MLYLEIAGGLNKLFVFVLDIAMAVYKPMLEFTKLPQYVQDRPKRRRQRVKTPDNPRVKAISHDRVNERDIKWVSSCHAI